MASSALSCPSSCSEEVGAEQITLPPVSKGASSVATMP